MSVDDDDKCPACLSQVHANAALAEWFMGEEVTYAPLTKWNPKADPALIRNRQSRRLRGSRVQQPAVHVFEDGVAAWGQQSPVLGAVTSCGDKMLDVEVVNTKDVPANLRYCRECIVGVYHVVYIFWDEDGRALYVGQTKNVEQRFRSHDWISEAARVEIRFVDSREEALTLEAALITEHDPINNVMGRPRGRLRAV